MMAHCFPFIIWFAKHLSYSFSLIPHYNRVSYNYLRKVGLHVVSHTLLSSFLYIELVCCFFPYEFSAGFVFQLYDQFHYYSFQERVHVCVHVHMQEWSRYVSHTYHTSLVSIAQAIIIASSNMASWFPSPLYNLFVTSRQHILIILYCHLFFSNIRYLRAFFHSSYDMSSYFTTIVHFICVADTILLVSNASSQELFMPSLMLI